MPDKPKLGRPEADWRPLLIEMARQELRVGSAETLTGLARYVLEQYPAEDRSDGNLYRQLGSGRWATEEYAVSHLRKLYQRDRSRLLFEAKAIEKAWRSGQQRTARALRLTTEAPKHRGNRPKSLGSINVDLLKRLLAPALLERCAAAFLRGHEDVMRKQHRKP